MKNCSLPVFVFALAPLLYSQKATTAPPSSTPPPTTTVTSPDTAAKPHGPEAVADKDPNRVVATIDGKQITAKQALDLLKPFPPEQRKQFESNLSNLVQQIYMRVQLADLAAKMNLDQQTPWKDQIAFARQGVLAQAYIQHLTDTATNGSPIDTKKYYDDHPDEFDQLKLSGIFVNFNPPGTPASPNGTPTGKTEQQAHDKADDLEKQLRSGGDFAALARTNSDNQATAEKGGDLGLVEIGDQKLPPAIREAINKLQPGQTSEPVRIQNAYLIIKVDSRKKLPFTDVEKPLEQRLKNEQNQNVVKQEVDKYKIKVEDPDFFEAPNSRAVPTLQRPASPTPPAPQK